MAKAKANKTTAPVGVATKTSSQQPRAESQPLPPVPEEQVEQIGPAEDQPREAIASAITFPIARPEGGHCPRSVSTDLTRRQGAALKAILAACVVPMGEGEFQHKHCEVYNALGSQPVKNYGNCVRWLLDRVADAHEAATGEKLLDNEELVF